MKIEKRFKINFFIVCIAIFASGAGVWIFDEFIRVQGLLGEEHHPAEQTLLHAHGISAYLFLISFGYLLKCHIQPGLRGSKRKISGVSLLSLIGVLTLTAFPILYASDGSFRSTSSAVHTYLGLGIPTLFLFHFLKRRPLGI